MGISRMGKGTFVRHKAERIVTKINIFGSVYFARSMHLASTICILKEMLKRLVVSKLFVTKHLKKKSISNDT